MLIIEHILVTKGHHLPRSQDIFNLEGDMIVDVIFKTQQNSSSGHMSYPGSPCTSLPSIVLPHWVSYRVPRIEKTPPLLAAICGLTSSGSIRRPTPTASTHEKHAHKPAGQDLESPTSLASPCLSRSMTYIPQRKASACSNYSNYPSPLTSACT